MNAAWPIRTWSSTGGRCTCSTCGQDRARRQRLGVARSGDGVHWTKLRRNPILELGEPGAFDEEGLGEPAVWVQGRLVLDALRPAAMCGKNGRMGLARSGDGVSWEARGQDGGCSRAARGGNHKVVCDPTVELGEGVVRVWYGGGDVARPRTRASMDRSAISSCWRAAMNREEDPREEEASRGKKGLGVPFAVSSCLGFHWLAGGLPNFFPSKKKKNPTALN